MHRKLIASGGRTPLFRAVLRALRQSTFLAQHPELTRELPDIGARARHGDLIARREFMKQAARIGILMPVAGNVLGRGLATAAPRAIGRSADPVAIIGAGAAGLTAAYRLHQAGVPCELFEGSARTGGRIYTLKNFNKEGMFCELGAELVDSNHVDLMELARELGVTIQELKDGDSGVDLFHFDGKLFTEKDLIAKFDGLANAIAGDQERLYVTTDDGQEDWSDHARALDKQSIREWLDAQRDKCDRWILDLLDVAYCGEYGREVSEQSSLNLLDYIDPDTSEGFKIFGDSDESKRVKNGNSTLMDALVQAITGKVPLHQNHVLTRIAGGDTGIELTFQAGGAPKTVKFARVISAIPFTLLREVEGLGELGLDPTKLECIRQLGYGTNMKVMYGFTEKLWRKPDGRPECNGSMYTSLASQCFWETSRKQEGKSGILTNFLGGKQGLRAVDDDRKKETLGHLDAIIPGLGKMHDGNWRSWVWPTFRFTKGSYSCPLVGQMTTLWDATAGSELDGRLLFAGEHTSSDFGGFMNGAIESGNRVAQEVLSPR